MLLYYLCIVVILSQPCDIFTLQSCDIILTLASIYDKKMTSIKRRIAQLPDFLGISKTSFFSSIGVAPSGFRGEALNGDVSSDVIVRIMTCYPSVNIEWLLQNQGSALKEGDSSPLNIGNTNQGNLIIGQGNILPANIAAPNQTDLGLFSFFQAQMEEKDRQFKMLSDALQQAQNTIHTLSEQLTKLSSCK